MGYLALRSDMACLLAGRARGTFRLLRVHVKFWCQSFDSCKGAGGGVLAGSGQIVRCVPLSRRCCTSLFPLHALPGVPSGHGSSGRDGGGRCLYISVSRARGVRPAQCSASDSSSHASARCAIFRNSFLEHCLGHRTRSKFRLRPVPNAEKNENRR